MTEQLEEVLSDAFAVLSGKMRVCIPGFILSQQGRTVTVSSAVPFRKQNSETGLLEAYQPDPISNVPVYWPEGSGGVTTFPLESGQRCLLIMSDRALDSWKGGGTGPPLDVRRFDLSDAICFPGGRPPSDPLPDGAFDDDHSVVFLPGGMKQRVGSASASDPVAMSSLVDGNFSSVSTALNAFVTAWNATQPTGGPVLALPGVTLVPVSTSGTGSTKLESE